MEKVKNIAQENKSNLIFLFLGGAILAGINTFFCRADYNLFIYLYMSYVWKFIDIFWCIYWNAKWNNLKVDSEGTIHSLVILTSWIGVLLKLIIIGMIGILEWNIIKTALPKKLQEKLNPEYSQQIDELNPSKV